jgi:uncharacterized protein (TIGR03435 family)
MKVLAGAAALLLVHCPSFAQTFEVASVKPSLHTVGRDANRQVVFGPAGLTGRNVTLKRLIVEAYELQPHQVAGGPGWLDDSEYDIDAKTSPVPQGQLRQMLRGLLAERFHLSVHPETRELHVYELVIDKGGPKLRAVTDPANTSGRTLQQFANLLSIQLTIPESNDPGKPSIASGPPIPVLDKTGLSGLYDIPNSIRPELGADMFQLWQRVLQDQLGLKLESRKSKVEVLVVERAEKMPVAN